MSELIAEASVLVRPDTKAFRATLQAELTAATRGLAVSVPVNVKAISTEAAKKSVQSVKTATDGVIDSTTRASASSRAASLAAGRQAAAEQALTRVKEIETTRTVAQIKATTRMAVARADLAVAANAQKAAEQANVLALKTEDAALKRATATTLANTQARRQNAQTALEQAASSSGRGAQAGQGAKGAFATGLAALGARGATLAASSDFLIGAAGAVAILKSSQAAAELERQLAILNVTAEASSEEMRQVSVAAKSLGRDITLPGVGATDAAVAMTELAKAGLSVQDSIAGARGVLQLSIAAQIDLASATGLVANALSAFKLEGADAVRVADLFSNASIQAQGSIDDFGLALKQSAGAAVIAGVSLEDTVALLTLLARNGLTGSDAGTSLRVALLRLASPTKKAREELKGLNVELRDAQGNIRPEAFAELGVALNKLSVGRRQNIIRTVFGDDASRAFSFLSREGVPGLRAIQEELDRSGTTAEIAGAQTAGFSGKIENLKNQAEGLATVVGEGINPVLGEFIDLLAADIGVITDFSDGIGDLKREFDELSDAIPFSKQVDKEVFGDFFKNLTFGSIPVGRLLAINDQKVKAELERAMEEATRDIGPAITPNFRAAGDQAADAFADSFGSRKFGLSGFLENSLRSTKTEAAAAGSAAGKAFTDAFAASLRSARLAIGRATSDLIDIEFRGGGKQETLSKLRELLEEQRNVVADLVARRAAGTKVPQSKIDEAKKAANDTAKQIEALESDIANEADRVAREAEKKREDADSAFLNSLGGREARLRNEQLKAQADESLANDIKAAIALRNFFKRSIAEIRRTVKDAQTERDAVATATRDYITARQEVADLYRERARADREERQAKAEAALEGFSLDVQIAEALGNRGAEIKAREREIAAIRRLMSAEKVGSNERKRLRLELITKQKELRELKGEAAKANQAFSEMTFEFLRTQQGFGANLLGNLIPLGAASGLVGNASSASSDFRTPSGITRADQGVLDSAGISGARAGDGAKATQMSVLIEEVRGLRRAVESYNRRRPDASATYALDTVYYADDHGGRAY